MRVLARALVLVGLCALVVGVRGTGFERVFERDGGGVVLAMDDAQYHARRAAYTVEHFPAVLAFDPYLNFPHGAWVPWPPLYDFALGAAGRLLGALDLVLAWAPVVLAVLTGLVVHAIGRLLGGRAVGALALGLFALLPASARTSSVGNPDHHAAVTLVATCLLGAHVVALAIRDGDPRARVAQTALVVLRVTMLLTWHGSLLYVAMPEVLALAVAAGAGRRGALLTHAAGCGAASLLGFALLVLPHSAVAGPWSPVELSRLQPTVFAAVALAALAARAGGGVAGWVRILRAGLALAVLAGAVLAVAWDGVAAGLAYGLRQEPFIADNFETQPLWRLGRELAVGLYGHALWLLPLAPLAALDAARRGRLRGSALLLAGWTAALGALALTSARYASDLAPAVSLCLALGIAGVARRVLVRRPGWRVPVWSAAGLVVLLLMLPTVRESWPHAARSALVLAGHEVVVKRPGPSLRRSVYHFVDAVRAATPETGDAPTYGILVPNTMGFAMNARGGRPTPAGNFGPYVGREGLELTRRFYRETDEKAAVRDLRESRIRYVVTSDAGRGAPASMLHRLHQGDGSAANGRPALGRFRLVTEGPPVGVPLGALGGAAPDYVEAPYKLFERVPGAILAVRDVPPRSAVVVSHRLTTAIGREVTWRSRVRASRDGMARIRVPYPGRYELGTETGARAAVVRDEEIRTAAVLDVP